MHLSREVVLNLNTGVSFYVFRVETTASSAIQTYIAARDVGMFKFLCRSLAYSRCQRVCFSGLPSEPTVFVSSTFFLSPPCFFFSSEGGLRALGPSGPPDGERVQHRHRA